jgi:hypothetical protein
VTAKPKLSRGHSITFKVTATGRSRQAAIAEILAALDDADVPPDAQWKMEFHRAARSRATALPTSRQIRFTSQQRGLRTRLE